MPYLISIGGEILDYVVLTMLAMFCIYAITVICMVSSLNKKDKEFAEERKDYLNRLMAKNSTEYIKLTKKEEPKIFSDAEILGDDRINGILN